MTSKAADGAGDGTTLAEYRHPEKGEKDVKLRATTFTLDAPVTEQEHNNSEQQGEEWSPESAQANERRGVVSIEGAEAEAETWWCSWCFRHCPQQRCEDHLLSRDLYQCQLCKRFGCRCLMCGEAVTRAYGDKHADKLCAVCGLTVRTWGIGPPPPERGRCSWCFRDSEHELYEKTSILERDVYECVACKNRTNRCRRCKTAFTRAYEGHGDNWCGLCNGYISDWNRAELERWGNNVGLVRSGDTLALSASSTSSPSGLRTSSSPHLDSTSESSDALLKEDAKPQDHVHRAWCSWCLSYCDHHLETYAILDKSTYRCSDCMGLTAKCSKCDGKAMVRSYPLFTESSCTVCASKSSKWTSLSPLPSSGSSSPASNSEGSGKNSPIAAPSPTTQRIENSWEDLRSIKEAFFLQRSRERVIAELERDSEYKEKARQRGMIRPFLLLVAMPAFLRCQVCNGLVLPLFNQDFFGDPHREAWFIIDTNLYGIQARANRAYERINPFASNCNWWHCLTRTMETTLHKKVSLATSSPLSKFLGRTLSNKECSEPSNPALAELEEIFLDEVISQIVKPSMSEAELQEWDAQMAAAAASGVYKQIANAGHITKGQVLIYAVNVARTAAGIGKMSASILALNAAQSLIPAAGVVLGPAAVGLSVIALPVMVLGIAGLTIEGIQATIGSSEEALLGPITIILNQRLLLAAEGLSIENYY